MKTEICPSMMCADIFDLQNVVSIFEKNNIDYLHIDVMDGSFVPNFTLGTDYCRLLKERTDIPLDIHLMIDRPEDKIDWFPIGKNDYVSVHAESTNHLQRALARMPARSILRRARSSGRPTTVDQEPRTSRTRKAPLPWMP